MQLSGIVAALTTPFDERGEVAHQDLAANLARYHATPLTGYLILGSSGEAIALDREEKLAVLRTAAEASRGAGKLLLAGTGEESLRATLAMTLEAAKLGYDAAVVRTPHYYKKAVTPAALTGFYREVANQSPIPIVVYNIPPLTGVDVGWETVVELSSHSNIAGLKESSGNFDKLTRIAANALSDFSVMVGGASTLYPSLCAGAKGAILALAAAAPDACCAVERAYRQGDHDLALAAQRALLPACRVFEPLSVPGLKAAVDAGGYRGGLPRLPLLPVSTEQGRSIREAIAAICSACATA